jgi:hypothetical protein
MVTALAILAVVLLPSAAVAQDPWCAGADEIFATVEDSVITVHHVAAAYNCCPDGFAYEVSVQGTLIDVTETEILTLPCPCLCCFNLTVDIAPIAPGTYTLAFFWYDYETGAWQGRVLPVIVRAGPAGAVPAIAAAAHSACLEQAAAGDPPPMSAVAATTWGAIKSLYR